MYIKIIVLYKEIYFFNLFKLQGHDKKIEKKYITNQKLSPTQLVCRTSTYWMSGFANDTCGVEQPNLEGLWVMCLTFLLVGTVIKLKGTFVQLIFRAKSED